MFLTSAVQVVYLQQIQHAYIGYRGTQKALRRAVDTRGHKQAWSRPRSVQRLSTDDENRNAHLRSNHRLWQPCLAPRTCCRQGIACTNEDE